MKFWESLNYYSLKSEGVEARILDIIFFADETVTSTWHGTQVHPIVITLGNLPIWKQAMDDSKLVIRYVPKLTGM